VLLPRATGSFVVSFRNDPFSADATELVDKARPAFAALNATGKLTHFRGYGGHLLDEERFKAMIDWTVAQFPKHEH